MISIVAPRADQQPPGSRSAINAGTLCECLTASRGGDHGQTYKAHACASIQNGSKYSKSKEFTMRKRLKVWNFVAFSLCQDKVIRSLYLCYTLCQSLVKGGGGGKVLTSSFNYIFPQILFSAGLAQAVYGRLNTRHFKIRHIRQYCIYVEYQLISNGLRIKQLCLEQVAINVCRIHIIKCLTILLNISYTKFLAKL